MSSISPSDSGPILTWGNVLIGLVFIGFDSALSQILGLEISASLIIASMRCIFQLTFMAMVLDKVFASNSILAVFAIAVLLNVLGAIEVTYNKSNRRMHGMVNELFSPIRR